MISALQSDLRGSSPYPHEAAVLAMCVPFRRRRSSPVRRANDGEARVLRVVDESHLSQAGIDIGRGRHRHRLPTARAARATRVKWRVCHSAWHDTVHRHYCVAACSSCWVSRTSLVSSRRNTSCSSVATCSGEGVCAEARVKAWVKARREMRGGGERGRCVGVGKEVGGGVVQAQ